MTLARDADLSVAEHLDDDDQRAVLDLAAAAEQADGTSPLDDQVRLDLKAGTAAQRSHLLYRTPDSPAVVGYAHLDTRSPDSATAHIVVAPTERRQGIGLALVASVLDLATTPAVRAWAHGDGLAAAALAESLGWHRDRELRQLRLALETPIADPAYPADVRIRPFEPGHDEQGWLEVNAAAFRDHPEQGRVTLDDLLQREHESWFDPAGFFVAERGEHLLGSHWTKVHRDDDGTPIVGEVYVVGIHPQAQGLGLGKALTLIGLHHLRRLGVDVMLYADASNTSAISLYERLGFATSKVDVMYAKPADAVG